jgi:pyridoxine 4-dehydrogenase
VKSSSQRPCILTPSDLVIATKVGFARRGPGPWTEDGRPQRLREAVHGSLSRLRIDRIDLLQLHRIDPKVPVEDQLGTLKDLQADGLIRFVGLSEVSIEQLERARTLVDVVSVQNLYNFVDRWADPLPGRCEEYAIGFLPWSPLRIGRLAARTSTLADVAARLGASPSQVALAWLLHRSPVLLPITGSSKVAHLEENVAAAELVLPTDLIDERPRGAAGAGRTGRRGIRRM